MFIYFGRRIVSLWLIAARLAHYTGLEINFLVFPLLLATAKIFLKNLWMSCRCGFTYQFFSTMNVSGEN
jgi:hypothetical protein